ncbi:MAG: hypothetical protein AAFV90_15310 [Cyanobacteria bacterium J06634_5]
MFFSLLMLGLVLFILFLVVKSIVGAVGNSFSGSKSRTSIVEAVVRGKTSERDSEGTHSIYRYFVTFELTSSRHTSEGIQEYEVPRVDYVRLHEGDQIFITTDQANKYVSFRSRESIFSSK